MSLLKPARGLPKYVMECGWWRHPAWVGARPEAIVVQMAAVSYCMEHETDGRLPGPGVETLATALGLDARAVKRGVEELLERGRWADNEHGYEIVGYLEHNASSAEIREHRERRSLAGQRAAAARWQKDASDSDSETQCETHAKRSATTHRPRNARAEQSRAEDVTPSAARPPTRRGTIFVSIVMACGINADALTTSERRDVNKTAKELDNAGIDPEKIAGFPAWWERTFPGATLTHRCLREHWSKYASNGNGAAGVKTRVVDGVEQRFMAGTGWVNVS